LAVYQSDHTHFHVACKQQRAMQHTCVYKPHTHTHTHTQLAA